MIFIFVLKYVIPVLLFFLLVWWLWPKAAQKVEQVESERQPEINKAKKMAKKNKAKAE